MTFSGENRNSRRERGAYKVVASIARQSVILKCLRQKSVLLGNYEFYYLAGLMKKLYGLELDKTIQPEEMFEKIFI